MSAVKGAGRAAGAGRYKPYPVYKDSGVEWLGEIPAHWEVKRIRDLAEALQTGPFGSQLHANEYVLGGYPVINPANLRDGRLVPDEECTVNDAAAERLAHHRLRDGDILFARRGEHGRCGLVTNQEEGWLCGTGCLRLRVRRDAARSRFLIRLLSTSGVADWLGLQSVGATMQNLNTSIIGRIPLVVPPTAEQETIAAFLDRETARIDALVAKKERLIALLQEQRTALITRAVTKGLPSTRSGQASQTVPMKDSGVEWLGEIPAHWAVERIKWVAQMVSGHTPDKKIDSYWQGGDIPWVSLADTGQLREVDYLETTAVMTTSDGIAHSSAHVLPAGTVVFSRDATIGLCAITRAGMAVSQHFIGWACGLRLRPEYLLFVLRSMTQGLERLTMGATVRTIGMSDVRSLSTPIPPPSEQDEIVREVLRRRAHIDALVAKVREAVERLKELRTALISAAVTGKIDVREEVA